MRNVEASTTSKNIKVGIPSLKLAGRTVSEFDASHEETFMKAGVKISVAQLSKEPLKGEWYKKT